tara:strand:- start:340 stop:879 length:540 start_codon:yes stop_codon:yes gene_type:complete
MIKINKHSLYPTDVYITNFSLNFNLLINTLYKIKNQDKGNFISNIGGWQSSKDIFVKKELNTLKILIKDTCLQIYNKEPIYKQSNCWGNISSYSHYNNMHDHARDPSPNKISGIYYLQVNDNSGNLKIHDNSYPQVYTKFNPQKGDLIFFQSSIFHSVEPNFSREDRISIAFNIYLKSV